MSEVTARPAPDPLALSWLLRADLRQGAAVASAQSRRFRWWWVINGRREYPAWADRAQPQELDLFSPLPGWPRLGQFGMTPVLHHLFEQREDLPQVFDTSTPQGLWAALAWFYTHGLREHGLLDVVDAPTLAALDDTPPLWALPAADAAATQAPQLTWLMFLVWRSDSHLQEAFDLRTPRGRESYLPWFLLEGVPALGLAPLMAQRWRDWLGQGLALRGQPGRLAPRAALLLWQRRKDLQLDFDLREPAGMAALAYWAATAWRTEPALRWLQPGGSVAGGVAALPAPAAPTGNAAGAGARPFGLNLIGFAFGELGIGEDVRMAAAACEQAGVPYKVVNIHPGGRPRQADRALEGQVADTAAGEEEAPYAINLFCLTGFDTVRVFLERGGPLFDGRYNIGWWPWELPVWPADWQPAFGVVNEVWAASRFTQAMYASAQVQAPQPVPVLAMPLPASVDRVTPMTRRALGLPAGRFLFLYVFDFNSYLARKNPFAALQAFRKAFAADDQSVGLVLKTMNSNPDNPAWQRFVRACAADARIVLIDRTLDRGAVLGLIKACDAYVSLHRSEGFGRTLAEAMLFGKPVVGTDFSGNTDFLTPETGFPVRWKRQDVQPGEYPFVSPADAAWWAEPLVADAARQMRAAHLAPRDTSFAPRLKASAQAMFSPRHIGQRMRTRLEAIFQQSEQSGSDSN